MSQHGSARPRHGYASPVTSVIVNEINVPTQSGVLMISDSFKRSAGDNLGIQRAKIVHRKDTHHKLDLERRSKSKDRDCARRREKVHIMDSFNACEIEECLLSRSHEKRLARSALRSEHRDLLKWKARHSAYLLTQRDSRRLVFGELNSICQHSDILLESGDGNMDQLSGMEEKDIPLPLHDHFRHITVDEVIADEKNDDYVNDYSDFLQRLCDHRSTSRGFSFLRAIPGKSSLLNCKEFLSDIKKKTSEFSHSFDEKLQKGEDYLSGLLKSPMFEALRSHCKDKFSVSLLDLLVSTLSFVRLSTQIPFSFLNVSSLCWLYLRSLGFNRKSTLQAVAGASLTTLVMEFINHFRSYNRERGIVLESYGETIDGFLTGATNFLSHPLISSIRNIIIFMASLHLFEKPIASSIYKHLGKPEGFSILSLILTALSDISTMIKMGEVWLFGKPGAVDLLSENPLTSAVARISHQIDMSEYVYCGLPIEGYVERNSYIMELKDKVENLTQAITLSPKSDVRRLKADVKLREGQKLLNMFYGAAVSGFRATPLGVIVHGNPGVGKSHVLKFICHIHSVIKGRAFKEEFIYTRNGEFWENYSPFSHPYVHYPEAGKKKSSQALAKGDETMDELLAVIDNLSYPVNMAFKDKGKVFALPEMVIIDTNNPSLNFDQLFENPAAFRRRFLYVEPKVVAKYSTTGEVGGDFDKEAKGASEAGTDAWLFNVYTQTPKDNIRSERQDLLRAGTADDLIKVLTPIFVKHILYEEEMLKRLASGGMFSKHDELILKTARLNGAIANGQATILPDGKVDIHPDSVYSKVFRTDWRKEAGEVLGTAVQKVFDVIDQDFKNPAMADVLDASASVTNVQDGLKDMDNLVPEPTIHLNAIDAVAMGGILGKYVASAPDGERIAALLNMEKKDFLDAAPKMYSLSDIACYVMTEWEDSQITEYAYSLGMFKFLRVVCDRQKATLRLEKKDLFGRWIFNDDIVFNSDSIMIKKSPIFNLIIGKGNGFERFWDAHHAMSEVLAQSQIESEFDGVYLLETIPAMFYYLWVIAFFFACKLTLSQNLKWNFKLSNDRIYFICFSIACCYFECYSVWIGFMVFFFTCLSMQDNFRHQGLQMIEGCIADGLDGLGYNFSQTRATVVGVPDRSSRRNFWKLKAIGVFLGVSITAITAFNLLSGENKKKRVPVSAAVPTQSVSVNVSNINTISSDKVAPLVPEKIPDKIESESVFSKFSEHDVELIEKEKSYHCGQSIVRIPNKIDPTKWNVRVVPPPKYTGESSTFIKKIGHNCRAVLSVGQGWTMAGHVFGLWDNYAVMHNHSFRYNPEGNSALVSTTGYQQDESVKFATLLDSSSFRQLTNDLILVRLNQVRFCDIRPFIPKKKHMPQITTAFIGIDETAAQYLAEDFKVVTKHGSASFKECYEYTWNKHAPGRCGTPLIGQAGKGWVVLGVHSGAAKGNHSCIASVLDMDVILAAAADMESKSQLAPLCSANLETLETEDPSPKSVTRHVEMHGSIFHGKLPGNVIMPSKSKVCPTGLNDEGKVDQIFSDVLHHQCTTEFAAPPMRGFFKDGTYRDPDVLFASKVSGQKQPLERKILDRCIREFSERILKGLRGMNRTEWQPWDIDTAINGAVNDAYARAMDLNKASGYGRKGKKAAFFEVEEKSTGKWAEMLTELRKDVLMALRSYEEGTSPLVFFEACLKDEPRDKKKCEMGKTRTFCVSPLVNLIITRMFFGPFYSTMVERGDVFCTAIGTDMHRHAHDLYCRMGDWSHLVMEMDYGNYDQTMPYEIGWAAGSVVYNVCKSMGYTDSALKILSGLISDNLHPFVILKQDVIELPGYQPSGKYGTAEDNSIRGVIMLMYIWYHPDFARERGDKLFFEYVLPFVYGDDVLAAILKLVSYWFNNLTYSAMCEKYLGLGCTPASKGSTFTPFVELNTMMFLKRKFRKHKEFDRFVAPLDLDSLMKTLSWHIPSNSVSKMEQVESALDSVVRELFFHCDREEFSKITSALYDHAEDHFKLQHGTFHRLKYYDLAYATLCTTSRPVVVGGQDNDENESPLGDETSYDEVTLSLEQESAPAVIFESESLETLCDSSSDHTSQQGTDLTDILCKLRADLKLEESRFDSGEHLLRCAHCGTVQELHSFVEAMLNVSARCSESDGDLSRRLIGAINAVAIDINEFPKCPERVRVDALKSSLNYIERVFAAQSLNSYQLESAELDIGADNATEMKHENLRDVAGDYVSDMPMEKSFTNFNMTQTDVDLRKFLSRPLLISQGPMNLDTAFAVNYDVYNILLKNGDIRSKLRNFALFRADLCIKVTISATPFHQGRVIAAWVPWYNNCPSAQQALTYVTDLFGPVQYLSTCPIQKTIDLKSNKPIELKIPFMHPQPMGRLFNNNNLVIPATADFDDFVDIGRFFLRSINVPESVSSTATNPYYQVYAWFENITYTVVTGTKMDIKLESDERITGPVEKWASSAVEVFDSLSNVPSIAPFAVPSAMVSRGVRDVAAHAGWSRPSLISDPVRYRNEVFTCASHYVGGDLSHKITFDPKQELSIDPSPLAVHSDEMVLSYLCAKEQLLDTADYRVSSVVNTPFWSCAVHPRIQRKLGTDSAAIPSPMALASSYFGYWHGDITFRFDVVKTTFHKGKFAIFWDPNVPQSTLINAAIKFNSEYMYIVDIQEVDDLEITVKWSFPQAWAAIPSSGNSRRSLSQGSSFAGVSPNFGLRSCNGYLSMIPITSLQSPLDKSVHINVYIKSDNMHFNVITGVNFEVPWTEAPPGLLKDEEKELSELDIALESNDVSDLSPVKIVINTCANSYTGISSYHFGEEPLSWRSLLKRYRTYASGQLLGNPFGFITAPVIPPLDPPVGSSTLVYRDEGFLGVMRRCYVGCKGGFKYRVRSASTIAGSGTHAGNTAVISMLQATSANSGIGFFSTTDGTILDMEATGSSAFVPFTQPGVEFELPFFSTSLFHFSQLDNPLPTKSYTDPNQHRNWRFACVSPSANSTNFYLDAATGEDFMLMHFLSSPMMVVQ